MSPDWMSIFSHLKDVEMLIGNGKFVDFGWYDNGGKDALLIMQGDRRYRVFCWNNKTCLQIRQEMSALMNLPQYEIDPA